MAASLTETSERRAFALHSIRRRAAQWTVGTSSGATLWMLHRSDDGPWLDTMCVDEHGTMDTRSAAASPWPVSGSADAAARPAVWSGSGGDFGN